MDADWAIAITKKNKWSFSAWPNYEKWQWLCIHNLLISLIMDCKLKNVVCYNEFIQTIMLNVSTNFKNCEKIRYKIVIIHLLYPIFRHIRLCTMNEFYCIWVCCRIIWFIASKRFLIFNTVSNTVNKYHLKKF